MSSVSPLIGHRFVKMNGIGNAITILDLRGTRHRVTSEEARAIAQNPPSTFDQLMVLHDAGAQGVDAFIRIYNSDGSESGACGNGTRCVSWALFSDPLMKIHARDTLTLQSKAGLLPVTRLSEWVFSVNMGAPKLRWNEIPLAEPFPDTRYIELQIGPIDNPVLHSPGVVNMGNPHAVFFVDDIEAYDLSRIGPMLEYHPIFPERANISLAQILAPDHIRLKVWERGVGLTLACGSAACAALVAASRRKFTQRKATISLPGGDLQIAWREGDDHVIMTGAVEWEQEGVLEKTLFSSRSPH
jgi:diaminopimelate epimerase